MYHHRLARILGWVTIGAGLSLIAAPGPLMNAFGKRWASQPRALPRRAGPRDWHRAAAPGPEHSGLGAGPGHR
jgi:hypothetical protein